MAGRRARSRWPVLWGLAWILSAGSAVAVAWSCALWSPQRGTGSLQRLSPDDPRSRLLESFGDFDTFALVASEGVGWERESVHAAQSGQLWSATRTSLRTYEAGWPLACMKAQKLTGHGEDRESGMGEPPQSLNARQPGLGVVPLHPRWSGLFLNALILGSPAHLFFMVHGIRRITRTWRRMCRECGYDLRGDGKENAVCPECGTPRVS